MKHYLTVWPSLQSFITMAVILFIDKMAVLQHHNISLASPLQSKSPLGNTGALWPPVVSNLCGYMAQTLTHLKSSDICQNFKLEQNDMPLATLNLLTNIKFPMIPIMPLATKGYTYRLVLYRKTFPATCIVMAMLRLSRSNNMYATLSRYRTDMVLLMDQIR